MPVLWRRVRKKKRSAPKRHWFRQAPEDRKFEKPEMKWLRSVRENGLTIILPPGLAASVKKAAAAMTKGKLRPKFVPPGIQEPTEFSDARLVQTALGEWLSEKGY